MTKKNGLGQRGAGPVECLGMTFESEDARRKHFIELLAKKLRDPEFRAMPGFPDGSDEAILRMSDPPYYTACPNPFLADFVRVYGKPYGPAERYEREPFAADVSAGKNDQLYKAHGYHTKVPHLAIVPSILHYTQPGDVVLDGFCGSGMTGVAAQWCGAAPASYRRDLEAEWESAGRAKPKWGARRVILSDLSPAASYIASGYNLPFDVERFEQEAQRILGDLEDEIGWMYECIHTDGKTTGRINYMVWSEIFTCPGCVGEVNFVEEAIDKDTQRTLCDFPCPHCGAWLNKRRLKRSFEIRTDPVTGESWKRIELRPVRINYNVGTVTHERPIKDADLAILDRIDALPYPAEVPSIALPLADMYHGSRLGPKGVSRVHHFHIPRAAHAMAALWRKAHAIGDHATRRMAVWFAEQAIGGMTILNRYKTRGRSQTNSMMSGVYYIGSQHAEVSPWCYAPKIARIGKAFRSVSAKTSYAMVQSGDCAHIQIPDNSVDYVFTDPPFGENIYYADLNFLVEAWHGVMTATANEAIVDRAKKKGIHEYQELMRRCFEEYYRVLKPGRWMTVVFSNSNHAVWHAFQEALCEAGFIVADVGILDKGQGSFRQVTSSAVKQDLIISTYKPADATAHRFELSDATTDSVWAFVEEQLANAPVASASELMPERAAKTLISRMMAYYVKRGMRVPLSAQEFLQGVAQRHEERDGMYFLPDQAAEYDRLRKGK